MWSLYIQDWERKLVINLSNATLSTPSLNFLKHDLGFAISRATIPHVYFLIEIENLVFSVPSNVAKEI